MVKHEYFHTGAAETVGLESGHTAVAAEDYRIVGSGQGTRRRQSCLGGSEMACHGWLIEIGTANAQLA